VCNEFVKDGCLKPEGRQAGRVLANSLKDGQIEDVWVGGAAAITVSIDEAKKNISLLMFHFCSFGCLMKAATTAEIVM
jgi:hypothetical protein